MAVHGTTTERALKILSDGVIYSYAELGKDRPEIAAQRLHNATDELDIKLGLDKYAFLSMGRVHMADVQEVYFIFPNTLARQAGNIVALREIVHFGALVSPEAVDFYKLATGEWSLNVEERNVKAARAYFENIFTGSDFIKDIFPRFLQKYYPNINDYVISLTYPGIKLKPLRVGREVSLNAWEGPQLQVPAKLSLHDNSPSLLVTTTSPEKIKLLESSGFARDRIYLMTEVIDTYQKRYSIEPYRTPLQQGLHVNLALRDLALLGHHNFTGQDWANSMTGFRHRICSTQRAKQVSS